MRSVDCIPICNPKLPPAMVMMTGLLQRPSLYFTMSTPFPYRTPIRKLALTIWGMIMIPDAAWRSIGGILVSGDVIIAENAWMDSLSVVSPVGPTAVELKEG